MLFRSGARFSTFASWWIKQSIKRMLVNATQPVHIPAYMVDLINRYRATMRILQDELNRTPTSQELITAMDIPMKKLVIIRRALQACTGLIPKSPNGEPMLLSELFVDVKSQRPDEQVEQRETIKDILVFLEQLDHRDARVIRLRFGLEGQEPLTLKEIGMVIGLTRERVRQIEIDSLRRLRERMQDDKVPLQRRAS